MWEVSSHGGLSYVGPGTQLLLLLQDLGSQRHFYSLVSENRGEKGEGRTQVRAGWEGGWVGYTVMGAEILRGRNRTQRGANTDSGRRPGCCNVNVT